jgi:4-hydroxy-tetrahydrodipicolinate synthase
VSRSSYTRREYLQVMGGAVTLPFAQRRDGEGEAGMTTPNLRGALMILHTPFTPDGAVDWEDLAREVRFVDRCGAQGAVWPQGSSSVASLSKEERFRGMQVLAEASRGLRLTLVLGVQGRDTGEMLEYARHAESLSPGALIAMPPTEASSQEDYRSYFRALGQATRRPVIVQSSGGARDLVPSVELLLDLAREMPNFGYVKEESDPLFDRMRDEIRYRPPMKAVFGANFGDYWLSQLNMGADGVITGSAMYADVFAKIWEFHSRGNPDRAREAYARLLLMRNLTEQIPGTPLYVMKMRGVFKTTATRAARQFTFTAEEIREIEFRFAGLEPYLV